MGPMSTIRLRNRLGLEVHEMVHPKNNAVDRYTSEWAPVHAYHVRFVHDMIDLSEKNDIHSAKRKVVNRIRHCIFATVVSF